jgi:Flp pilus assembly protein TadG
MFFELGRSKKAVLTAQSEMKTTGAAKHFPLTAGLVRRLGDKVASISRLIATRARNDDAAELLEFALALPLILVMLVGLLDFAHAYNIKQKLANAAREGARVGQSLGFTDTSSTSTTSVQTIKDDVTNYLAGAGVDTSFIGTSVSWTPAPSGVGTYYTTSGGVNYGLKVERLYHVIDSTSGADILSVKVTLNYPYNWSYGFNHIIKMLVPSSTFAGTIDIETDATMSY